MNNTYQQHIDRLDHQYSFSDTIRGKIDELVALLSQIWPAEYWANQQWKYFLDLWCGSQSSRDFRPNFEIFVDPQLWYP